MVLWYSGIHEIHISASCYSVNIELQHASKFDFETTLRLYYDGYFAENILRIGRSRYCQDVVSNRIILVYIKP